MKRETTNKIRYVLEELLPPALHDSRFMRWLYRIKFGGMIDDLAEFRRRAPFLTEEEYRDLYERMPRIQEETDCSQICIDRIVEAVVPGSVCDIGCGTGYLLKQVKNGRSDVSNLTGVDYVIDQDGQEDSDITFIQAPVEKLPFKDNEFDNVICTHVLEHILDIQTAIAELRRVAAKRLIIVVPIEREHEYTFNPHFHFFPFEHSFLRIIQPAEDKYTIANLDRDIFYVETMSQSRL